MAEENGNGGAAQMSVTNMPPGYASLTPLLSEKHAELPFKRRRDYKFAATLHAVPLAADEFARAQQHFPIVFTNTDPVLPVALLGVESDKNDFVGPDGAWREHAYVPAYVRRYPFALVREKEDSDRMVLCADLTAENFAVNGDGGEALFADGKGTEFANSVVDFCRRFEDALTKTRTTCQNLNKLGLFEDANVTVRRPNGKSVRLDGFRVISEEKLRKLDDATLADLARRGVIGLIAAHHFSISQFSGMLGDQL